MTALLLLVGLLLVASGTKKKLRPPPGPEIPTGPGAENFDSIGEHLAYKPKVANRLIQALLFSLAIPTDQPNVLLVLPGPNGAVGPTEWGAYYGLKLLHDEGNAIWVPLSFHWPDAARTGRFVIFLPPAEKPPQDYALLKMPDEPWPALAN